MEDRSIASRSVGSSRTKLGVAPRPGARSPGTRRAVCVKMEAASPHPRRTPAAPLVFPRPAMEAEFDGAAAGQGKTSGSGGGSGGYSSRRTARKPDPFFGLDFFDLPVYYSDRCMTSRFVLQGSFGRKVYYVSFTVSNRLRSSLSACACQAGSCLIARVSWALSRRSYRGDHDRFD